MNAALTGWLLHPVTMVLAGVALSALFVTVEVLARSLAELGNVRFQGILDENPGLLGAEATVPLSRLLDVVRWLQLVSLGLLWMVIAGLETVDRPVRLLIGALVPFILVAFSRILVRSVSESAVARLIRVVRGPVAPVLGILERFGSQPRIPSPEDEEEEASEAEIQAYLEAGAAAGIFEGEEGEIVESLVDFFDTVVREVMTPRTEMVTLASTVSFNEILETFSNTHKSRIPVYEETVDRIIGVIHVKDLVADVVRGAEPSIAALTRECQVVPESKPLGELLRDFQERHQQMAIVVDEYGGTSGLVTLEDILEEIVGEIRDEHDAKGPPECLEVDDGVYRMVGRAPLDLLEEKFQVEIDQSDVDTVGGLVFSLHGTVPEPGTEVIDATHGLVFTVNEMDERRIVSVTVSRAEDSGVAEPEDTDR